MAKRRERKLLLAMQQRKDMGGGEYILEALYIIKRGLIMQSIFHLAEWNN